MWLKKKKKKCVPGKKKVDAALTAQCQRCIFCMEAGFKCGLCFFGICGTAWFMLHFCETCLYFKRRLKRRVKSRNDSYLQLVIELKSAQEGFVIT